MKHLKVGNWVNTIDAIHQAYLNGHVTTWTAGMSGTIGQFAQIIKKDIDKRTDPKRYTYGLRFMNGNLSHGWPVECLELVNNKLPDEWFPLNIKPIKEKRNYQVYVGMTEDGHLCFIYYEDNKDDNGIGTIGWHKYQRQDSDAPDSPLIAWTTFADWPKAFDLYNEKTKGKQNVND